MLLADDEKLLTETNSSILESMGYKVFTGNSGNEALRVQKKFGIIDLVITDMTMPGMTGLHLTSEIKSYLPAHLFCSVPVLTNSLLRKKLESCRSFFRY